MIDSRVRRRSKESYICFLLNTFSHEEAVEYIKNILWVNCMPHILSWDADTGKNKKTYEEMLSITDDPTKIITLQ